MNNSIIEQNLAIAEAFLKGTHSSELADLAVIDRTVDANIVCHGFPGGNPVDRESYKDFFRAFREAFNDMTFSVPSMVADERYVHARWCMSVTHCGEFAGIPATGRRVTVEGMVLYRIKAGLIAETWLQLDQLALLSQIGALNTSQAAS
jgi:steroid delta-isomerase-like uncharacterized protein